MAVTFMLTAACVCDQRSNPIVRLRHYLQSKGWWSTEENNQLMAADKKLVLNALKRVRL